MNSAHENSVRCGSGASSQRPLRLGGIVAPSVSPRLDRDDFRRHRLGRGPLRVDQQRLGVRRDLLRLGEDILHGLLARFAGDDLPRQGEHEVVAVVPVGGEAVRGEFTLHGERALQLLRHQLEGVRLEGVPVGHEDDLHGLCLADAPGPARGLAHRVDGVVRLEPDDRRERRWQSCPECGSAAAGASP